MVVVVTATGGGGAAAVLPYLGYSASVQVAVGTAASEAALAAALAAGNAGAAVAAEAALAAAIAAENAAIAAASVTAANLWNPAGWALGAVLIGASQHTTRSMTWGCYKPIIGEVDTNNISIKPMAFADLVTHPEVRQVFVCESATHANLPDVEVVNKAGQRFLLQGVLLPWGSAAYHAERIDKSVKMIS